MEYYVPRFSRLVKAVVVATFEDLLEELLEKLLEEEKVGKIVIPVLSDSITSSSFQVKIA